VVPEGAVLSKLDKAVATLSQIAYIILCRTADMLPSPKCIAPQKNVIVVLQNLLCEFLSQDQVQSLNCFKANVCILWDLHCLVPSVSYIACVHGVVLFTYVVFVKIGLRRKKFDV
jgi:hypothetical protein